MCCTVIGVLLAVLLGRLDHWRADTRQIRLQTAMAAVNRAAAVFRTQCLVLQPSGCNSLPIDGLAIAGAHGHAAARPEGIARLAGLPAHYRLHASTREGVPTLTVDVATADTPPCQFTYVQAPHAGAASGIDPTSVSCP